MYGIFALLPVAARKEEVVILLTLYQIIVAGESHASYSQNEIEFTVSSSIVLIHSELFWEIPAMEIYLRLVYTRS